MKYLILSALVISVHVQADLIGKPVVRHTITHEAKHIEAAMQSDQVDEYEMLIRLTDGRYFWVSREGKEVAVSRTLGYITYQRTDGSRD